MSFVTYKNLYSLVVNEIDIRAGYNNSAKYNNQTSRTLLAASVSNSDVAIGQIVQGIQEALAESLPSIITEGLVVEACDPISEKVIVHQGKGSAGGYLYETTKDITVTIPFDYKTEVFYINLYKDSILVEKTMGKSKLTLAKIVVPAPNKTAWVQNTKDDSWNAYIVNFREFKIYEDGYGNFEEDSLEILRSNMGKLLADNLIGNIRLSEDLKITNTQGSLTIDSKEVKILSETDKTLAKFNRNGTFFYDANGIEMARFTNTDARIGNMVIDKNSIHSGDYISEERGFKITDSGYAEFQDVRVRGRLSSSVFEYDKVSAIGGKLIVGNASSLALPVASGDNTITVEDSVFSVGEVILIKAITNGSVDEEYMLITNTASAPTYAVTRDISSAHPTDPTWDKGTAIVSTGIGTSGSRSGFILLDAVSQYAPFIDINSRNSETYNDYTTKVRLGNLEGINDPDYGGLTGFGLYSDNVFLKGSLYAPTIKTATTGSRIELTCDGLQMYNTDDTVIFAALLKTVGSVGDQGDFYVGCKSLNQFMCWDQSAAKLCVKGDISVTGTVCIGDMGFTSDLTFNPYGSAGVTWAAGSIRFSNGCCCSFTGGGVDNLLNTAYIYYDDDVSNGSITWSYNYSDATGEKKVLVATVEPSLTGCAIITTPFKGTTISGDCIVTGHIYTCNLCITTGEAESGSWARTSFDAYGIESYDDTNRLRFCLRDGHITTEDICLVDPACSCNYSYLAAGALKFHDVLGDVPYVKRIDSGQANTGDTVVLNGWTTSPKINVSVKSIMSYNSAAAAQCQKWDIYSDAPVCYNTSSSCYGYCFVVHATLTTYSGQGSECVKDINFGACATTETCTCSSCVRLKFLHWCNNAAPSNYYYGVECYAICYRKSGDVTWCACCYCYEQPHASTSELKCTQDVYKLISFPCMATWEIMACRVSLNFYDASICSSITECCVCTINGSLSSWYAQCYACLTAVRFTCTVNTVSFAGLPSNVYCSILCWKYCSGFVFARRNNSPTVFVYLKDCAGCHTAVAPDITGYCLSLSTANRTYASTTGKSTLDFINCFYSDCSPGSNAFDYGMFGDAGKPVCVINICQTLCYCVVSGASGCCSIETLYSLCNTYGCYCTLDPNGVLNWIAISYS